MVVGRWVVVHHTGELSSCGDLPCSPSLQLGAVLGFALLTGIPSSVLGGVLGFAAGTFLFISACGIVPELLHAGDPQSTRLPILAVLLGYGIILFVNSTLHAHAH